MKIVLFVFFFIILLLSSLIRTDEYGHLTSILYGCLIIGLFLMLTFNRFRLIINKPLLFILYLFMFTISISTMLNNDEFLLIYCSLFVSVILISIFVLPSFKDIDINKLLFWSLLISHFPIIIFPILLNGIDLSRYSGVFYNPNTFGNTAVTLFAVVFSVFIMTVQKSIEGIRQKLYLLKIILNISALVVLTFLVLISNSRTSFLSLLIIVLAGSILLGYYLIKNKKIISFVVKGSLLSLFVGAVLLLLNFTKFYDYLYLNIIYKFQTKIQSGDVLDQRGYIWEQTISEGTLFGHGNNYFSDTFSLGAHNTLIYYIGTIGFIPSFLLSIVIIMIFAKSIKYSLSKSTNIYKYLPFILSINFLALSMGEDMSFKLAMFLMFFSVSVVYMKDRRNSENIL